MSLNSFSNIAIDELAQRNQLVYTSSPQRYWLGVTLFLYIPECVKYNLSSCQNVLVSQLIFFFWSSVCRIMAYVGISRFIFVIIMIDMILKSWICYYVTTLRGCHITVYIKSSYNDNHRYDIWYFWRIYLAGGKIMYFIWKGVSYTESSHLQGCAMIFRPILLRSSFFILSKCYMLNVNI